MKKSIKLNALLNMVKQVMQVIFPLITVPYITRVLLPEYYGRINTGNSLISYISLIAGLGIASYAIREGSIIRQDKKELNEFSNQVFSINLLSTMLSYALLVILLLIVPHYRSYSMLLIIQGSVVLFSTLGADWINSIEEDYLYLTIRYIVLHVIALVLMFLFVKKPDDYYLYAAISLVTSVGGNILNMVYIRKYVKLRFTFNIDWKKHLLPIMILFGNSIAMTIYVSSDITMLEIFKGDAEVGIYSVSTKIYSIVKQVLNAILIVSVPRMTQYVGSANYTNFLVLGRKILGALLTIMCPFLAGVIVFRAEAIAFAGGNDYISATSSLFLLILAAFPALLATFFSSCALMPLRKERNILIGTIISAILNVVLNLVCIPKWGGDGAALTTLISETFVAIYFGYLLKKENCHFFDKRIVMLTIVGTIIVVVISLLFRLWIVNTYVCLLLAILCASLLYAVIQILGKNEVVYSFLRKGSKVIR